MKRIGTVFSIVCVLILVVNTPSYGQLFDIAVNYPAGDGPASTFAVDLDGDGDVDVATANDYSDNVSILKNNGNGTFQVAVNYGAGDGPGTIFAADLDGDGDSDLATANYISNNVSILKNNGDGTFQPAVNYSAGNHSASLFAADLDGDNDSDLAITNWRSSSVSIMKNNGDGTFQPVVNYSTGAWPHSVFAADFDGDGDNDLAVGKASTANYISILKNNGDGTFQTAINYSTGTGPRWVFAIDLDGDSDHDLAVANRISDNISILKNNGDRTFQPATNYVVGDNPTSISAVDLDGDGDNDLAAANWGSDNVSILLNNGNGTFQEAVNYSAGDYSSSVYSADLDGDGDNDLAVGNVYSDNVSILMNLTINIGSICVSVNSNDGSSLQGVIVTVIDENNDPVGDPIATDENGEAYFDSILVGQYSVMIVTPLGYTVSPAETQTNVAVIGGECTPVDFVLTPTVITNDSRTIGYWKHQFNVYSSGRGNAQESYADLEAYLDLVHQHFDVLGIYVDLENFDFEAAKNILAIRGGSLIPDRAKQQLFALLLNLASGKIGQETVVSDDGQVAAEAVTLAANLINNENPDNDELAKTVCDLINNGQMVGAGIIPESPIRYKFEPESLPQIFSMGQNFPNPFNAQTTISYALPEASHVRIEIYDLLGRLVTTLGEGDRPAGRYTVTWNAADQSSGMYFYKIQAGEIIEIRKMSLIK